VRDLPKTTLNQNSVFTWEFTETYSSSFTQRDSPKHYKRNYSVFYEILHHCVNISFTFTAVWKQKLTGIYPFTFSLLCETIHGLKTKTTHWFHLLLLLHCCAIFTLQSKTLPGQNKFFSLLLHFSFAFQKQNIFAHLCISCNIKFTLFSFWSFPVLRLLQPTHITKLYVQLTHLSFLQAVYFLFTRCREPTHISSPCVITISHIQTLCVNTITLLTGAADPLLPFFYWRELTPSPHVQLHMFFLIPVGFPFFYMSKHFGQRHIFKTYIKTNYPYSRPCSILNSRMKY